MEDRMQELEDLWDEHYPDSDYDWEAIREEYAQLEADKAVYELI